MRWLSPSVIATRLRRFSSIAACRLRGENPHEILPVGPCTRMSGDVLIDGEELPRWMLGTVGKR